jgi:nicotinate-nucleotide adenylyltransferase
VRLGLFGGSFDPVHNGHLALARAAKRELKLARVYFVPVRKSPLKRGVPLVSDRHRLAMLKAATAGKRAFRVNDWELRRPGPSYTYKTLRHFRSRFPRAEWFLLMGGDSWRNFRKWKRWREIVDGAQPVAGGRRTSRRGVLALRSRIPDVSSTGIRARAAEGLGLRGLVPPAVERHIKTHGLYR